MQRALIFGLRRELSQARASAEEAQCLHDEVLRELAMKSKAYDELEMRYKETLLVRTCISFTPPSHTH